MKTNLPPQAYTRDVFANAYEWLQTQSHSIKELAQTPDDLVALYLQARRHGHLNNTQATGSSKSFKNDLKNLAEGLRQFEEGQTPAASAVTEKVRETTKHSFTFTHPSPPPPPTFHTQVVDEPFFLKEDFAEPVQEELLPHLPPRPPRSQTKPEYENTLPPPLKKEEPKSLDIDLLDERSKDIIYEVKKRLNLSRDEEALRMLLVLGKAKLYEILPS